MSIYMDCVDAIQQLLADPRLHASKHRGFFTDLDVAALASRNAGGYSDFQIKEALVQSSNALGKFFTRGKVARFGPVHLPGVHDPDYARIATKIVHADVDGPKVFETPNGKFKQLMVWEDKHIRSGRRFGTNRDDLERWDPEEMEDWKIRSQVADLRRGVKVTR